MGFSMANYFATFVVLLIAHEKIFAVNGQCTVPGCDNGDPLNSLVAEIQQLKVDLFDQLNKQVQSINELNASFQEMKSQHTTVNMSLQAVDRYLQEDDIYSRQFQSIHEILNQSFQEIKTHHDTFEISLQAVDRRSQEHDILIKQGLSIHEFLNESFQEIKNQHDTVMKSHNDTVMRSQLDAIIRSLQAVDRRRSQEHDIDIKQFHSIHMILNESFEGMKSQHDTVNMSLQAIYRCSKEHDIYIKQGQSVHEILNHSFQEINSHHDTIETSLQEIVRRSKEQDIYIKQGQSIHELLNESFQEMKSQHGTVMTNLQALDRRLQEQDISMYFFDRASQVKDCSDIKASGKTASGVYVVCVGHQLNRTCTSAYCDMETASLVFQRRKDGSVNFNRTWAYYKQGFGDRNGEFWLGNEMLYLLTSKRNYKLRVDLEDFHGNKSFAEYTTFSINSSAYNYRLTVGGYSGTAGDSLYYNSGQQFSTNDADNGGNNCARSLGAGWWYGHCSYAHLNGIYHYRNDTVDTEMGFKWQKWHNSWRHSLKAAEMKLVALA